MRIGIDARLWNETGVGRYIRNLVSHLAKIDKENTYVVFLRKPEFETLQLPGKNFEKRLADIRWHTVDEQISFPNILEKENLDLVHFPYFSFPLRYKGKFVITIHDLILHHFSTGKASTLPKFVYVAKLASYKFIIKYAAKHAEKIIAVSNATRDEIVSHLGVPSQKVLVTYEGFDTAIAKQKAIPNLPQKYFLYVGNAYPHKNIERLIEAFGLVVSSRRSVADSHLVLAGREDFFYERLKKRVTNPNIHFYHDVSDSELAYMYEHAIATVIPSLMEGFGLPALEAMAHACPIVVSDIPVLHEICKDAAVYFDPLNTHDLAEKLEAVYKEKNNKQVREGLQRVKDFSWEKMARETLQIYKGT